MAFAPVQSKLAEDRCVIESYLAGLLNKEAGQSGTVCDAMRYAVFGSAQRIRPILTMRIARVFNVQSESIMRCAAAVELLHCASLIIDDLPCMDDSPMRRSRASVHIRYGEATALLAAFGLVALAARIILDTPGNDTQQPRLVDFQIKLLKSLDCAGLIAGQALDLEFGQEPHDCVPGAISELKTVPLFTLAVSAGTLFARLNDNEQALLNCFGREFGLAFQMSDDVLDGDAAEVGAFQEKVTTLRAALAPFGAANHGLSELVDYLHARVFPQQ